MSKYDWSLYDKDIIKMFHEGYNYQQIADEVGLTRVAIDGRLRSLKLRRFKHVNWTDEIIQYILDHYCDGARPISDKFNIPITAINKKAQELGVKFIPKDSYLNVDGYVVVGKSKNRKFEHRKIYEEYYGVKLTNKDIIHHIDGNKQNNDINNLKLMTRAEHMEIHRLDLSQHDIVQTDS